MTTTHDELTLNEIERILAGYEGTWDDGWWFWTDSTKPVQIPGLGICETVAEVTGGEGDWHVETYVVVRVTDEETGDVRFFRKDGYYESYDGTTWDGDFREVSPTEKTVTVYV